MGIVSKYSAHPGPRVRPEAGPRTGYGRDPGQIRTWGSANAPGGAVADACGDRLRHLSWIPAFAGTSGE